jgi:selenocysteine lyase/cysteine desulfurase
MFDVNTIRSHFPSLDSGTIFFDNPGGTQIVREATDWFTTTCRVRLIACSRRWQNYKAGRKVKVLRS